MNSVSFDFCVPTEIQYQYEIKMQLKNETQNWSSKNATGKGDLFKWIKELFTTAAPNIQTDNQTFSPGNYPWCQRIFFFSHGFCKAILQFSFSINCEFSFLLLSPIACPHECECSNESNWNGDKNTCECRIRIQEYQYHLSANNNNCVFRRIIYFVQFNFDLFLWEGRA